LHVQLTADDFSAGDLIAFSAAVLLTLLLLALTLRAAKLPGTPKANILFAVCALVWSFGGLLQTALVAAGVPRVSQLVLSARALQLTGAAAFPLAVLLVWRSFASKAWQRNAMRRVIPIGVVSVTGVAVLLWLPALFGFSPHALPSARQATAWNAAVLLLAGALISLRRHAAPRPVYLSSLAIVACAWGAALSMLLLNRVPSHRMVSFALDFLGSHLILAVILCSFFLFARFRYADVFVHYGVRIVLAGVWAAILAFVMHSTIPVLFASHLHSPAAAHVLLVVLAANALLLSFTFLDERMSAAVNRWLFRTPDYRAAARELANRLPSLQTEAEVTAAVEDAARVPLELSGARVIAIHQLAPERVPPGLLEGEIAELDPAAPAQPLPNAEALIPISSNARVSHALAVAPGLGRPGLVSAALDYLRGIAAQCGHRLEALRREREAIERESREALLLQQVTEAELNALRAQLHPHFLFNSLNTIADLIVRDPRRAEEMTLRLAGVFRHVLAHLRRPLTPVRDEIAFLRAYLYIEEARFGDRLQVEINMDPEAAGVPIPSFILQPLVENALKHGLGAKPGPGRLWIVVRVEGDTIRMTVEDDGLGPVARPQRLPEQEAQGVGLANIAERLRTLYQDRASIRLEPREGGGACATVIVPRTEGGHSL
jgi:two-component system, LytTR family, sensor kinase